MQIGCMRWHQHFSNGRNQEAEKSAILFIFYHFTGIIISYLHVPLRQITLITEYKYIVLMVLLCLYNGY